MSSQQHPNILLLMTDQHRPDCIGALGNPTLKTPSIDRLVREGTTFTKCYTPSPVCMPARHSLTSGISPHLSGCVDNVCATRRFPSFMEYLSDCGYQTHGVGKMHFSKDQGDWGFSSLDTSEEVECTTESDDYKRYLEEQGYGHILDPHGLRSELYYMPQPSQLPDKHHHSHWVADRCINFLENRDESKPFMLWCNFIKPHPPFETPNPWGRLYRMHEMEPPFIPETSRENWTFWNAVQNRYKYVEGLAENRNLSRIIKAAYYAAISFVDLNIGRILEQLGSDIDDTLVVFTSDHGELLGDFGCYGKRSMLDPSARVPLVARLPGFFPEDSRCGNPTSLMDLFPTFTSLAGSVDNRPDKEAVSLKEALEESAEDRIVFSQYSQNELGLYMASDKNWKYIYSAADNKEWLYDLTTDPLETDNKFENSRYADHLQRLKGACIQRYREDGYTKVLNGDDWKRFEPLAAPAPNSDEGLLFQDPEALDKQIEALANYARSMDFKLDKKYQMFSDLLERSR